jgi:hypothetical protein
MVKSLVMTWVIGGIFLQLDMELFNEFFHKLFELSPIFHYFYYGVLGLLVLLYVARQGLKVYSEYIKLRRLGCTTCEYKIEHETKEKSKIITKL